MIINQFVTGKNYKSNADESMAFHAVSVGKCFATFAFYQRADVYHSAHKHHFGQYYIVAEIGGVDFVYLGVRKTQILTDAVRGCQYGRNVPVCADKTI